MDNAILAHRLCNRIDYSISVGRSYASDLERIRKAREDAIRRNHFVEATHEFAEPVEETEQRDRGNEAEAEEDEQGACLEVPTGR